MNDAKIATPRVGPRELVQTTLAVLALVGLLAAAGAVLWPFLGASLWAAMIVVATWPIHRAVERRVGHRRWLSVTIMSLGLMLLLLVPAVLLVDGLIDAVPRLAGLLRDVLNGPLPDPPAWLVSLPGVGDQLAGAWRELTDAGLTEITRHLSPYAGLLSRFALGQIGGLGYVLLHLLMTLVIAAVFYAQGEAAAQLLRRLGRRLAGNQGEGAVLLAGQAIQGVALGVGGTALLQALLGGIGLGVAHVPFAVVLTAILLVLCIAQIGPGPVLIGACVYLYVHNAAGAAGGLLIWTLVVIAVESVVRPILIRRGADLPLLLIFAGVIGGLLSFGLVGIFVGPVVLAVTYTLLKAWLQDEADLKPRL